MFSLTAVQLRLQPISVFGKSPARPLGTISAPDNEAAGTTKAIEYFHVEPAHHFRVVVTKLNKVKERSGAGQV